jgi:dolichol-phosphate mannosyltransferase
MDTDFNHHPKYIPQMIRHLQQHPETVISGSRYIKGGGMDKREQFFGSHLINFAGGIILGCPIHDFTGGYILLSKKTLDKLPLDWIFRGYGEWGIRLHYSLYRSGIKTKEIPVFYPLRKSGNSKTKPLSYAFVLLRAFIETRLYFK